MRENIYGSLKRLEWMRSFLRPGDRVLEVGCGTGWMITVPLLEDGVDIRGIDLDRPSVEFGKKLLSQRGLSPNRLRTVDLRSVPGRFDVIITSEVLEHLEDKTRFVLLRAVQNHLAKGGLFLVTVPNGQGWFERENAFWRWAHVEAFLRWSRLGGLIWKLRQWTGLFDPDQMVPSTLSSSPHVQCYDLDSIARVLEEAGFEVVEKTGSVLVAGPLSNLLGSGLSPVTGLNGFLGGVFPSRASGFFVACRKGGKP